VPQAVRRSLFHKFTARNKTRELLCGDGRTWGAVHIELKHEVPNWAEALTCMRFAISYGEDEPGDKGRINYRYRFGNAQVIVVTGELGIISAYPTGNNVSRKWSQCAAS
jgi:hypothetical protein